MTAYPLDDGGGIRETAGRWYPADLTPVISDGAAGEFRLSFDDLRDGVGVCQGCQIFTLSLPSGASKTQGVRHQRHRKFKKS